MAAVSIAVAAWGHLFHPQPLEQVGLGLGLALVATAVNGGVATILLRAGRRLRSITLRADAHHLFTDVWTSAGVVLGIFLVKLTGWLVLDPIIALLVAANIVWAGFRLLLSIPELPAPRINAHHLLKVTGYGSKSPLPVRAGKGYSAVPGQSKATVTFAYLV